jgi:hypothetical protein
LSSFVGAFNSGDDARLDALFAQRPLFRWYSSGPPGLRRLAAAKNRATLIAYFRTRHLQRDRLRVVSFRFNGNTPGYGDAPGYGNVAFTMKRSAADHRRGSWFGVVGKGAAVCSDDASEQRVQFIVMSLGGPARSRAVE